MKLLILRKNGTLVSPLSGETNMQYPQDQKDIPGVLDAIRYYKRKEYAIAIASSQDEVAAGQKTLTEAIAEMEYCLRIFPEIDRGVFCPDTGDTLVEIFDNYDSVRVSAYRGNNVSQLRKQSYCRPVYYTKQIVRQDGENSFRKPASGMLDYLIELYNADRNEVIFVGDRLEDEQTAINAGVGFVPAEVFRENKPSDLRKEKEQEKVPSQTFGKVVRQARKSKKLTQRKLGALIGADPTYLSKLESDNNSYAPGQKIITLLAEYLDLNIEELSRLSGRMASEDNQIFKELVKRHKQLPLLFRQMRDNPEFAQKVIQEAVLNS